LDHSAKARALPIAGSNGPLVSPNEAGLNPKLKSAQSYLPLMSKSMKPEEVPMKVWLTIFALAALNGTLVFEKLHSVPVEFMVEEDDTAPKEDPTLAEDGKH
jgi:hypothetical protein